jgi:hypothetical protein
LFFLYNLCNVLNQASRALWLERKRRKYIRRELLLSGIIRHYRLQITGGHSQLNVEAVLEQLKRSSVVGSGAEFNVSQELLWHRDSSGTQRKGYICHWMMVPEKW